MYALSGYIDNNTVVVNENISSYEGRSVIITILDSIKGEASGIQNALESRKEAARKLAGLWKAHSSDLSVDEEVRSLRRGRRFDI